MHTAELIHHLLALFVHNHHDRRLLLAWYRSQQPGMPRSWYAGYVRWLIGQYPQAMRHCLTALQHHSQAAGRVCP